MPSDPPRRRAASRLVALFLLCCALPIALASVLLSRSGSLHPTIPFGSILDRGGPGSATITIPATTVAPATSVPTTSVPATGVPETTFPTPSTLPLTSAAVSPTCPPASGAAQRVTKFSKAPPMCIVASDTYLATFTTDVGTFVVRMNAGRNPVAVNNFVFLARYRFYDGTEFHRVIPGFVVQGGDPTGTGTGGPGYSWTGNSPASSCASSKSCYPDYSVAYANSGSLSSNGSQFFIVLPGGGRQITPKYTLFGQVIAGASVVAHIGSLGGAGYTGIPVVVIHVHSVTITTQSD